MDLNVGLSAMHCQEQELIVYNENFEFTMYISNDLFRTVWYAQR